MQQAPKTLAHQLRDVADEALGYQLKVGRVLGAGSYSVVVAAEHPSLGACAVKIPWMDARREDPHPDTTDRGYGPLKMEPVSPTGPFMFESVRDLDAARALLRGACTEQQTHGNERPLARLHGVLELPSGPVAVYERIESRAWRDTLRQPGNPPEGAIRATARALLALHRRFGAHGDLKPEHILWSGLDAVFIDPLPASQHWLMGSIGYTLPGLCVPERGRPETREHALVDLAALAAIIAESYGGTLGWSGRLTYILANRGNGRFGRGASLEDLRPLAEQGTHAVPSPLRAWVLDVVERCANELNRMYGAKTTLPEGYCARQLARLEELC